jgi:hypothetical protein
MKELLTKGAGALAALAVLMAAARVEAAQIRAKVPFAFTVDGTQLPAGTYTIESVQGSMLFVRGFGSSAIVLSNGVSGKDAATPKLVFHRYGERYVLREAWMGGGATGRALPASKLEREYKSSAQLAQVAVPAF